MSNIVKPIVQREWELIRDRLGLILAQELATQAQLDYNDVLFSLPDVYIERYIPFNHTEMPAINVMVAQGEYTQETQETQDGTWTFYVDGYQKATDEDGQRGDQYAAMRLQRLMGVCQAIIMDSRFKTLLFEPGAISNRRVVSIMMADPTKAMEATNAVMARMTVEVRVSDDVELVDSIALADYATQAQLSDTAIGYLWGGTAVTPPVPVCDPGTFKNSDDTYTAEVPSGGTFTAPDIEVIINGSSIGFFPSNVDVDETVVVTAPVAYARPRQYQMVSQEPWDELYVLGLDTYTLPANGYRLQQIRTDIGKPWLLLYENEFGHLFRWTGDTGGYYNEDDGNYYDVNGVLSDKDTEFLRSGRYYIIDHWTGLGWDGARGGTFNFSGGASNVVDVLPVTSGAYSGFFCPTKGMIDTLGGFADRTGWQDIPPFSLQTLTPWTCTPYSGLESTRNWFLNAVANLDYSARTKATQTAILWYVRYHYT